MALSKRNQIILYILGIVLIIGIGIFSYLVLTGRIQLVANALKHHSFPIKIKSLK